MFHRRWLVTLVLGFAAWPALAYTIYLKDGSRIIARDKYEIRGSQAIITLPSGTESSLAADLIDVPRTEQANLSRLGGTAIVIEGGEARDLQQTPPPPPKPKLQDLIEKDDGLLRGPATPAPQVLAAPVGGAAMAEAERRGHSQPYSRAPYPDTEIAAQILESVSKRGIAGVAVHRGATPSEPVLAFETGTEGSVFKAILASCYALLEMQATSPGTIDSFDVVCETSDGQPAGRFTLTPKLADDIVSRRYEITRFYVENVQF